MSLMYIRMGIRDSALYFANLGNQLAMVSKSPEDIIYARNALAQIYDSLRLPDSALKYQKQLMSLNDSIFGAQKLLNFQQVYFDDQARSKEIEEAQTYYRVRLRMYALATGLLILLIATIFLIRNNRVRKKTNALLEDQKKELQLSLVQLKATQSQLIQSEKMASLGELTAGIAHEIQNPLNFVNNFSDVNKELIEEMHSELQVGNINEAIAISNAIKENEEKIGHHGKRADAIVKGMLQHSRISNGQKELVNINAIADECLRLSYQGFRAKEKAFRTNLQTDFDESIGMIPVVPQDMVRVFVNLFNNAFYAVNGKKVNNKSKTLETNWFSVQALKE